MFRTLVFNLKIEFPSLSLTSFWGVDLQQGAGGSVIQFRLDRENLICKDSSQSEFYETVRGGKKQTFFSRSLARFMTKFEKFGPGRSFVLLGVFRRNTDSVQCLFSNVLVIIH